MLLQNASGAIAEWCFGGNSRLGSGVGSDVGDGVGGCVGEGVGRVDVGAAVSDGVGADAVAAIIAVVGAGVDDTGVSRFMVWRRRREAIVLDCAGDIGDVARISRYR
jgi:hypothetical protein